MSSESLYRIDILKYLKYYEYSRHNGDITEFYKWVKNKTNLSSEKKMSICEAIDVTVERFLFSVDGARRRADSRDYYTVKENTDIGRIIVYYNQLLQLQMRDLVMGRIKHYRTG